MADNEEQDKKRENTTDENKPNDIPEGAVGAPATRDEDEVQDTPDGVITNEDIGDDISDQRERGADEGMANTSNEDE